MQVKTEDTEGDTDRNENKWPAHIYIANIGTAEKIDWNCPENNAEKYIGHVMRIAQFYLSIKQYQ